MAIDPSLLTGNDEEISHVRLIALGGFSEVHEMYHGHLGMRIARKIVRPFGFLSKEDIEKEASTVNTFTSRGGNPNVLTVFANGWLVPSLLYYFDMELCEINLDDYIHCQRSRCVDIYHDTVETSDTAIFVAKESPLERTLQNIWTIMSHITRGLEFIHCCHHVHGDLKPRNILYSCRHRLWKIGDFGTTAAVDESKPVSLNRPLRGTACYRAPELISDNPVYTTKVDMWALGCILFELATCKRAFIGDFGVYDYAATKQNLVVSIPTWPKSFESHLAGSVHELLDVNYDRRPSASAVRKLFNSYELILSARLARPLITNSEALPSYSLWKQVVQHPNKLKHACELAENNQVDDQWVLIWKRDLEDIICSNLVEGNRQDGTQIGEPRRASTLPVTNITEKNPDHLPKRSYSEPSPTSPSRFTILPAVTHRTQNDLTPRNDRCLSLFRQRKRPSRHVLQFHAAIVAPGRMQATIGLGNTVVSSPSSTTEAELKITTFPARRSGKL